MNRNPLFYLAAFLLSASSFASSTPCVTTGSKPFHTSQWITSPDVNGREDAVLHFRKSIHLDTVPSCFPVRVSADNQFILYINGKRAGQGPSKSDLGHWKYESFDISPLLHPGENIIAAVVWNFGLDSAISQMSYQTAFLLESDSPSAKDLSTNSHWSVEIDRGHTILKRDYIRLLHGYFAAPPGEQLDGRLHNWTWASAQPSGTWSAATEIGPPALREAQDSRTPWMLEADGLPPTEYSNQPIGTIVRKENVNVDTSSTSIFTVPAHTHATVLIDHGSMTTAYPELSIAQGRGAQVTATYAESLVDSKGQKGNRGEISGKHINGLQDIFLPDGSQAREYTPLEWRAFRYLQLDITTQEEPLTLQKASAFFTAYPFSQKATFESSDKSLQDIWNVSWRTARLDAHDTYMDTPYWERLQYVGDTRLQALISYSLANDDRLARQAIATINASRTPDGLTQSRYPSHLTQMIPPFSLLWIGMVHDFYLYRNDPAFVKEQLPGIHAVLQWFMQRQRADGLLAHLPWWNFVDWTKEYPSGVPPQDADGGSAVLSLQLAEALRYAAELEKDFGSPQQADLYRADAERILHTVQSECWDGKQGLIKDTPLQTQFSEQANVLAVWLGAVPAGREKSVMQKLLAANTATSTPHIAKASYYFRFYTARALEKAGMGDRYLTTLTPWQTMLNMGLTTWAEQPEPTRSDSHAWSSHPSFDLLRIVAGIKPASSGFTTVAIEPHPGSLTSFHASFPHMSSGNIEVTYSLKGGTRKFTITVPEDLPGEFIWSGRHYPLHAGVQEFTFAN